MATKKSASKMRIAKPKPKTPQEMISKKEYFESGKVFDGDVRQISIKEAYDRVLDKEIINYSSAGTYLKIKDLLMDLVNDGELITKVEVFDVLIEAKKYLNQLKEFFAKAKIEDFDIVKECLPNGKPAPKLKKNPFDDVDNTITQDMNYLEIAKKAIISGIAQTYEKMMMEDALKLSQLND